MNTGKFDWKEESKSFNLVATEYDLYRPAYPDELIKALIAMTGIHEDSRILEVGAGTGKATYLLAQRGYSVTCIEPGTNMASVACQNLEGFHHVRFEITDFENFEAPSREFDLVFSAQAFHWIPKEVSFSKASRLLRERGHLALFWNMYPKPEGGIYLDLERIYQQYTPELKSIPNTAEAIIRQREIEISESGHFRNISVQRFPWSLVYDTRQYVGLLGTYSDHLRLPEEIRNALFEGVARAIDRHGGVIKKPYIATLYVAQNAA